MLKSFLAAGLAIIAAQAGAAVGAACDWNRPGVNPFRGDLQRAIWSYSNFSARHRIALAWQVRFGKPDDIVLIGASGITGDSRIVYGDINDMHFGQSRVCASVNRSAWPLGHVEPAKAYRRGSMCVIVPDVCGNVSWTTCDWTPLAAVSNQRSVNGVPEPGTAALVAAGLLVCAWARRSKPRGAKK